MKQIIALQQYSDKYVSLFQGEIRNLSDEIADRLIEEKVVALHGDSGSSESNDKFIIKPRNMTSQLHTDSRDEKNYYAIDIAPLFEQMFNLYSEEEYSYYWFVYLYYIDGHTYDLYLHGNDEQEYIYFYQDTEPTVHSIGLINSYKPNLIYAQTQLAPRLLKYFESLSPEEIRANGDIRPFFIPVLPVSYSFEDQLSVFNQHINPNIIAPVFLTASIEENLNHIFIVKVFWQNLFFETTLSIENDTETGAEETVVGQAYVQNATLDPFVADGGTVFNYNL